MDQGLRDPLDHEAYSEEIARIMPCGLLVFDSSGEIRAVNDATQKLLGCRAEDLVGRPCSSWL